MAPRRDTLNEYKIISNLINIYYFYKFYTVFTKFIWVIHVKTKKRWLDYKKLGNEKIKYNAKQFS